MPKYMWISDKIITDMKIKEPVDLDQLFDSGESMMLLQIMHLLS